MPDQKLLDEWFSKIDRDILFLTECFIEVLEELGQGAPARALPWREGEISVPRAGDPEIELELQVLSIAYHLLNLVEENAAAQARRQRESMFGALHEPGLWGHGLKKLREDGYSEQDIQFIAKCA